MPLPICIRIFSNESALRIRGSKYWSFSFSISPFNEYSGLISFRMDRLDLLAVQMTLTSLLQHHGSKASVLPCSAFLIVQLSHPYMTTGKTIALTRQTFVGKVMSLHYNMLVFPYWWLVNRPLFLAQVFLLVFNISENYSLSAHLENRGTGALFFPAFSALHG